MVSRVLMVRAERILTAVRCERRGASARSKESGCDRPNPESHHGPELTTAAASAELTVTALLLPCRFCIARDSAAHTRTRTHAGFPSMATGTTDSSPCLNISVTPRRIAALAVAREFEFIAPMKIHYERSRHPHDTCPRTL